jgi:hypothetical protein
LQDLLTSPIESAGVIDYKIGSLDFFSFAQLRGHPALDFFPGNFDS